MLVLAALVLQQETLVQMVDEAETLQLLIAQEHLQLLVAVAVLHTLQEPLQVLKMVVLAAVVVAVQVSTLVAQVLVDKVTLEETQKMMLTSWEVVAVDIHPREVMPQVIKLVMVVKDITYQQHFKLF
jgi:uncharacterized membrane protein (DUF106 family)